MIKIIFPLMMTDKMAESTKFYIENFGYTEKFTLGNWYTSLIHPETGGELSFIDRNHPSSPEQYRVAPKGVILTFETDNAMEIYNKIKENNEIKFAVDMREEEYGQRHFMIEDPSGMLVDVVEDLNSNE